MVVAALAALLLSSPAAPAQAQVATKAEIKACKAKTKTMGCSLERGIVTLSDAARASTVAAGGPLPGKCQIDSPAITANKQSHTAPGLLCDDTDIADTGDQMIALCKAAATAVRADCRTVCAKLAKIDPSTGDPVEDTPCRMVVDRTVVTTKTDRVPGTDGCIASCEASIVCVCDP